MFYHFYLNHWRKIVNILLAVLTFFAFIYITKYLFSIAAPIFFGIIIFWITEPLSRFFHRRGMRKVLATTLSTLLFIIIIIGLGVTLGVVITAQVNHLAHALPKYAQYFQGKLTSESGLFQQRVAALPVDVVEKGKEYIGLAVTRISHFASGLLIGLFGFVTSFSKMMVNLILGLVFSFFLSCDIELIKRVFHEKAPSGIQTSIIFLREHVFKGILRYIVAQLKLMSITFLVVLVGLIVTSFAVTRVDNIFIMALIAAIFDVLPLLGISTLFIPWIIYLLIVGNIPLAISLGVLLIIVMTLRQILEPKIVGDSLGVIATVMLGAIIVFMNMLGLIGVLVSPVLIILIRALYKEGYFKRWWSLDKEAET